MCGDYRQGRGYPGGYGALGGAGVSPSNSPKNKKDHQKVRRTYSKNSAKNKKGSSKQRMPHTGIA